MSNPYTGLPTRAFWRRSVSGIAPFELDPLSGVDLPFALQPHEKVATAGSCFAQHIARNLAKAGLTYYVEENAPSGMTASAAEARQYGLFSARYGNLYTARQLLQIFERALGERASTDVEWRRPDMRFVDPYRPQVEPEGFETYADMAAARELHLATVRRMFQKMDVFVFTLGLTEGWRIRSCGTVLPLAPGVVAGDWDPDVYEFINFSAVEVTDDLKTFIGKLRAINPGVKVVLTVSPVPLIATYEHDHVVSSTIYSKSVLRIAAEEVRRALPDVAYFPSYEIITAPSTRGVYFADDFREVAPNGVAHAMRVFLKHFSGDRGASENSVSWDIAQEAKAVSAIVCDEEKIDSAA